MKLLFIYFYAEQATFKKGTIVRFSKKYDVKVEELDEDSHKFEISLSKKDTYQENFYSNNVDIGVVIGENGTGKSVLINTIRDNENDYALIVYENNKELFLMNSMNKDVNLKIDTNKVKIERIDNFKYIYYSSIIDTSGEDIKSAYNISNRNLLSSYDDSKLENRLSLIENDDIHKYFNMVNKSALDYAKIKELKLYPSETYFDEIGELIKGDYQNIFDALIKTSDIDTHSFIVKDVIDQLSNEEKGYIISARLEEPEVLMELLISSYSLSRKYFAQIEKQILNEMPRINPTEISIYMKDFISYFEASEKYKEIFDHYFKENINKVTSSNFFDDISFDRINHEEANRDFILHDIENSIEYIIYELLRISYKDDFMKFMQDKTISNEYDDRLLVINDEGEPFGLLNYHIANNFLNKFSKELLSMYKLKLRNIDVNPRIIKQSEKRITSIIEHTLLISKTKYFSKSISSPKLHFDGRNNNEVMHQLVNNNLINIRMMTKNIKTDFMNNIIDRVLNNFINNILDLDFDIQHKTKKLIFILSFKKYFKNLKDKHDKIRLLNFLNIINNQDSPKLSYHRFLIDKNEKIVSVLERLDDRFYIFNFAKELDSLNENITVKDNSTFTKIDDEFFKTYSKLIKDSIKPFTYEIEPPLSSGQKAILFIFARIDDAINKINKETKNKAILILLDEADLKLHLEWQRKLVSDLVQFLNTFSNNQFYILYATHSPMILSDITDDRTVFLQKQDSGFSIDKSDEDSEIKKRTFGANIYDLYHDSFFMDEFMGEFAQNKINDVINIINIYKIAENIKNNKEKKIDDFLSIYDLEKILKSYNYRYQTALTDIDLMQNYDDVVYKVKEDKNNLNNTIILIGEPLLRNKLLDDLKIIGSDDSLEIIMRSFENLSFDEIEEKIKEYDRETQNKVLKKLLSQSKSI